jgi:hypothetical protein
MKKTIILSLVILLTTIFNYSFGKPVGDSLTTGKNVHITTLIINANVTVVLVDNEKANLEVTGRSSLRDNVTFKEMGDTLVIGSLKNRDVKEAGVIYVPASQLTNIRINGQAYVTTSYALQIPKLDVVMNNVCEVYIASTGKLNLTATPLYTIEQTTEPHRITASVLQKLNNYF